jgi:cytochrome c-type biogenesis protein CcmH/NrfG
MENNQFNDSGAVELLWRPQVVYGMAVACLLLGLSAGYFLRGSGSPRPTADITPRQAPPTQTAEGPHRQPTLEEIKGMADSQARPALEQLKTDPKNKALLVRVAYLYKSTHQFHEASSYFAKALEVDPKDVNARTEMASCLYYDGDVDGALSQLQQSLRYEPKDANSLFNLGMIKWKGKNDPHGAMAAWQELLRTNPKLDRRPLVEQMMAQARQDGNLN